MLFLPQDCPGFIFTPLFDNPEMPQVKHCAKCMTSTHLFSSSRVSQNTASMWFMITKCSDTKAEQSHQSTVEVTVFSISSGGDSPTSLGSLFWGSVPLKVRRFFPSDYDGPLWTTSPSTEHHQVYSPTEITSLTFHFRTRTVLLHSITLRSLQQEENWNAISPRQVSNRKLFSTLFTQYL